MSWTHLRDTAPIAQKPYKCFLCGESIEPGTRYVVRSGIQGSEFMAFRMHVECEQETARNWDIYDWETFSPGDDFERPKQLKPVDE
jgi:hypothetical protein